jgi:hypothetical protein
MDGGPVALRGCQDPKGTDLIPLSRAFLLREPIWLTCQSANPSGPPHGGYEYHKVLRLAQQSQATLMKLLRLALLSRTYYADPVKYGSGII